MSVNREISLVPEGFEPVAHPMFFSYNTPTRQLVYTMETNPAATPVTTLEPNNCSICLTSLTDPVTLYPCNHVYCLCCISPWLDRIRSCPLCKQMTTSYVNLGPDGTLKLTAIQYGNEDPEYLLPSREEINRLTANQINLRRSCPEVIDLTNDD